MSVVAGWRRFWFAEGPYFDLAVVRMAAVGLQLFVLLNVVFPSLAYVAGLPDTLYGPLPLLRLLMLPFVGLDIVRPDTDVVFGIFWITFVLGFAALFGLLTNLAMLLFAAGNIFLQAYAYSFNDYHHPPSIMMVALVALAFAPSGRVLSVDSMLVKRTASPVGSAGILEYSGSDATWAIKFIQCFFSLMYISAAVAKLSWSGLDWMNGYTLQYKLIQDGMRNGSALSLWASQHHFVIMLSQIVVVVFQSTYFLVIFYPRLRWIYLPIGLAMHIGIYLTLKAPFPQWIIFYSAYIPWALAFRRLAEMRVPVKLASATGSSATS